MINVTKTYLVSFPRSGQHLVARAMQWVYPDWFVYSEFYSTTHNIDNNPHVNLQKQHDFDLNMEIKDDFFYVVLTREFYGTVLSHYDLYIADIGDQPDDENKFIIFIDSFKDYYFGFKKKWVDSELRPNMLRFSFDEIVACPSSVVKRIAEKIIHGDAGKEAFNNGHPNAFATLDIACAAWPKRKPQEHRYWHVLAEHTKEWFSSEGI